MRRTALALALATTLLPAASAQAPSFSTLEERMSAADFRRAGLEKLSEEELAALNEWLRANAVALQAAPEGDRRGFRVAEDRKDEGAISARIVGRFDGLSPRESFRLDNGQVWRSVDSTAVWRGVTAESPAATIRKGLFGGWRMTLDDHTGMAKVERVE